MAQRLHAIVCCSLHCISDQMMFQLKPPEEIQLPETAKAASKVKPKVYNHILAKAKYWLTFVAEPELQSTSAFVILFLWGRSRYWKVAQVSPNLTCVLTAALHNFFSI